MTKLPQPAEHGEPYLIALGRIAASFSLLEHLLTITTWGLIGPAGALVTEDVKFNSLLKLFRALVKRQTDDSEILKAAKRWCNRAERVAQNRNQMLHSMWTFNLKGDPFGLLPDADTIRSKLRGLESELDATSVEQLQEVAQEIAETAVSLMALMGSIRGDSAAGERESHQG
jgi:hypothetical protein